MGEEGELEDRKRKGGRRKQGKRDEGCRWVEVL